MNGTSKRVGKCSPTRLGVPSKLIRFPNAQRRAGRPRSSPRRFAAAFANIKAFPAPLGTRASLAPTIPTQTRGEIVAYIGCLA
ncbi:MAG: hypothetical protein LBQ66_01855 [Planctomycetaceae bacterium]|nr:hypothetical protein [Planctomycetaceae bacterium]